ncbi:MAG: hypothetical protein WCX65_14435 [bacterium]
MTHEYCVWIHACIEHLFGGMQIVFGLLNPFFFVFDLHAVVIISLQKEAGKRAAPSDNITASNRLSTA